MTGDARRRLIELHLPLVRALAQAVRHRGEQLDDLTQVGAVGLIKAIDRYDPARGSSLTAYAVPTIVGEIRRHLRDSTQPLRLPAPAGRRAGRRPRGAARRGRPRLTRRRRRARTRAGRGARPDRGGPAGAARRQRRIVQLHYFGNLSQRGIATELGLSQVHVSRLLHDSLGKLRQEIGQT